MGIRLAFCFCHSQADLSHLYLSGSLLPPVFNPRVCLPPLGRCGLWGMIYHVRNPEPGQQEQPQSKGTEQLAAVTWHHAPCKSTGIPPPCVMDLHKPCYRINLGF